MRHLYIETTEYWHIFLDFHLRTNKKRSSPPKLILKDTRE